MATLVYLILYTRKGAPHYTIYMIIWIIPAHGFITKILHETPQSLHDRDMLCHSGVTSTYKQQVQPPTIFPLYPPGMTKYARSTEIQIQAMSNSQKPHKHALKIPIQQ